MKSAIYNSLNSITLALLIVFLATAVRGAAAAEETSIMCVCRCCYQGDCAPLKNASWKVSSCSDCKTSLCNNYVASSSTRARAARLFDSLESSVPQAAATTNEEVDVCEIITVLEVATCSGSQCKRSTNLKAECYNRDAPLMKYTIQTFVVLFFAGTFFGLIKNHIPAFQEANAKYFNY